ncbi:MAG: hypothetical protein JWO83_1536 [Caulobacteraceae bacterium]|jgi:hypothetical protein|nr:hypothetical protein [Caulobacteraceae bacterium]
MKSDRDNTDIAWHRRFGRRLIPGEVGESRTRGGYINGRTALVLGGSLVGVIVALGAAFLLHGHF